MNKFLILILILAVAVRTIALSTYPDGLNADEAALGYNAYSLLLTGRDEHGHLLPVNLESFGDFKPALYSYLLVPLIKIFGLNAFAVRLPSALFGALSVFLIYYFAKQLLPNFHKLPLITSLALAVNPWAIHFSRGAWEVNLATAFILLGVTAFLRKRYSIFALAFILSVYTYQSARVIAPLIGLGLLIFYRLNIKRFIPYIVLLFPLIFSLFSSDASSRLSGVGLLADEGPLNRVKELRGQHTVISTTLVSKLLHNRPVIYTIQFISNYLDHYDGNFLFVNGDVIERSKIPETGLFYFTDFIFLFIGIFYLLRNPTPNSRVVWMWLLVAPIAAAMTFQTPHALRAQNLVVPLTLLISLGLSQLNKKYILIPVILIYSWQFTRFLHEYYVHYPQTYPTAWENGFDQVTSYILANQDKFQNIYITDKYDQPYILFLFYSQYPPALFQNHHQLTFRDKFNFSTVRDFGKYHFTTTSWDKLRDNHSSLIVAAPEDIPVVGVNVVKTLYFPNGSPAFKIVAN